MMGRVKKARGQNPGFLVNPSGSKERLVHGVYIAKKSRSSRPRRKCAPRPALRPNPLGSSLPSHRRSGHLAIEVWATLHHHLRLGSRPERITDEELVGVEDEAGNHYGGSPFLKGRSAEHARKGLEILERLGLIARHAAGSSRRVAIVARLKGGNARLPVGDQPHHASPSALARTGRQSLSYPG